MAERRAIRPLLLGGGGFFCRYTTSAHVTNNKDRCKIVFFSMSLYYGFECQINNGFICRLKRTGPVNRNDVFHCFDTQVLATEELWY